MTGAVQNPNPFLNVGGNAAPTGPQAVSAVADIARALAALMSLFVPSAHSGRNAGGLANDPGNGGEAAAQATRASSTPLTKKQRLEAKKEALALKALSPAEFDRALSTAPEAKIRQWVQGALGMVDFPDADAAGLVVRLLSAPNAQGVVKDIFNVAKAAGGEGVIPLIIEKAAQLGQPDLADRLLRYTMTAAVVWPDSISKASLADVIVKQGQYGQYMANAVAAFGARIRAGHYASFSDLWRAATDVRLGAPDNPDKSEFGVLRTKGQFVTPIADRYRYIAERVILAGTPTVLGDGIVTYDLETLNNLAGTRFKVWTILKDGKRVIRYPSPEIRNDRNLNNMFHAEASTLPASFDKMNGIYQAAMAAPDQATFEKEAARLYWHVAQAAPDLRGSAAKAEVIYRALFEAKGYPPPDLWRPGVSADLEAMLRTQDQWLAEYKGLQAHGADWVKEFNEISRGERTPVSIANKYQIDADGIARDIFGERVGTPFGDGHIRLDSDGSVVELSGKRVGTPFGDSHIRLDSDGSVIDLSGNPGPQKLGDLGFYRSTDGKTILKADGSTFGTLASETAATDAGGYIVDDQGRKIGFLDKNGGVLACTDDGKFLGYRDGEGVLWTAADANGQRSRLGALNAEGGCDYIDPKTGQTVATVSRDGVAKGTDFLDRFRADLRPDLELGRVGAGVAILGMLVGFGLMSVPENEALTIAGSVLILLDPASWPLMFPAMIKALQDAQAYYEKRVNTSEEKCDAAQTILALHKFEPKFVDTDFSRWPVPDVQPLINDIEALKAKAETSGDADKVKLCQAQIAVLAEYQKAYAQREPLLSSD